MENAVADHKLAYYKGGWSWRLSLPLRMSVRAFPAAAVGLALLLAGCDEVGPNFLAPAPPAQSHYRRTPAVELGAGKKDEAQRLALGRNVREDWWAVFRSPELDATVRAAVAGNRTLVEAEATLLEARQRVAEAQGGLFPQANLSAYAERERFNYAAAGIPFPNAEFNLYSIGPSVSYDLDLWGGTKRLIEEREAQAQYQDYQLAAAYLTLTSDAVGEALTIASIRAQIAAANDIIANDQRNLDLVQRELQAGEATSLDVETAQSQLANDRTPLPPLRQQLSVARNNLALLVGKTAATWTPPDFTLDRITLPTDLPVSLPSALVRRRPDILAAEAQLHAASAAIGVATAQLYPNIDLSAAIAQTALEPSKLFTWQATGADIMAGLTAPLFHGGELTAQKRAAVAAFKAARAGYEQTVLQAFTQVANALDALRHDGQLVDAQHRALDAAQHSLALTRDSYQGGNVGILLVLDAQRRYQQARLGYVRAVQARYLDTVQLFAAMGGGWQQWLAQAEPPPPMPTLRHNVKVLFSQ
jgi:NodT family efflux transporter outer membrane factor (OMF) lipoprotein